jgi:hypothetical protein
MSVPIGAEFDGLVHWEVTIAKASSAVGYRPVSRHAQPVDISTSLVGFR